MLDFYKAKPLKRLAAYAIDMILLLAITVGVVAGMFSALGYWNYKDELNAHYTRYEQEYGVEIDVTAEAKTAMSDEEIAKRTEALAAMEKDERVQHVMYSIVYILLGSIAAGLLVAHLILEVMLPLIFKNGQTVGKKLMGLCVMHKHHVRVGAVQIICRAVLGKYFIETLIPVAIILTRNITNPDSVISLVGTVLLPVIAMVQGFLVLMSQANCGIHDKLFNTVVADFKEQYIFDTLDERIDFEEAYEEEMAAREAAYGG